jgi:ABC-type lipoprotein release transport system permease subunit
LSELIPSVNDSFRRFLPTRHPETASRFIADPDAGEVLISQSLARKLDLAVGDRLVLMVQDLHNEIIGEGLVVTGLFESPMESFDKYTVFVGLKKLQRITGLGGAISGLTLLLADKDRILPERNRLRKALQGRGLEVLSWQDMAPNLVKAVALFDAMMYIFFAIVFATVIFSIANTLIMAVMERFHEIGVMKSIGTRPSWVFAMILFEAVNLGLVGLAAGIASGLALTWILGLTGINLSFYMESMRTWGTGSVIYPAIKPADIAVSAIIVFTTTLAAAIYPALKAARIKPLDALHFI